MLQNLEHYQNLSLFLPGFAGAGGRFGAVGGFAGTLLGTVVVIIAFGAVGFVV